MGSLAAPLTVGMPVYNGATYISQALDSVLAQTFGDFELIIRDNASSDGTMDICRYYAANDSRIVYHRSERNMGAANNFNAVFFDNRSSYFKFAAADDICAPTFLEACMAAITSSSDDTVLCFPRTIWIDSSGAECGAIDENMNLHEDFPHQRFRSFCSNYFYSNCYYGIMRAEAYRSTSMQKAYHSADVVLLAELALRGKFAQINEDLFYRRFHEEMSLKANSSPTEIRAWYDPSKGSHFALPRIRMFWELLNAIRAAPIGPAERLRCLREFSLVWLPKNWKRMIWDIVRALEVR